jgi:hypothetical protein
MKKAIVTIKTTPWWRAHKRKRKKAEERRGDFFVIASCRCRKKAKQRDSTNRRSDDL